MESLRLTRRQTRALSDRATRRLRQFAQSAGLSEDEAITFIFENFDSVINEDTFTQRLALFQARKQGTS